MKKRVEPKKIKKKISFMYGPRESRWQYYIFVEIASFDGQNYFNRKLIENLAAQLLHGSGGERVTGTFYEMSQKDRVPFRLTLKVMPGYDFW
ncbi:MAG TPA: hypothetical protein VEL47_00640 [Myxococcota bacterium]|nr:hypothetical protein [Myxococcota bacterium]